MNVSILKWQLFRIGNAWDFQETGGRLESYDMLSIKLPFFLRSLKKMLFNGRRSWIAFMMCLTCGLMSSADGCTWMVSSVAVLISRLFFQWRLSDSRGGYFLFYHQLKGLIFFKLENWWNFAQNQMCIYNWSFAEGLIYPSFRDLPFWRVKDISNFCRLSG